MIWFLQVIRTFFFSIDYNLYNFIATIYNLLIAISRTTILSQGEIKNFMERVQALIGVFMLFKVSFSLITYLINPDEFSDKAKGFGKLWQNIIISLIMLVLVPYAFNMAYDLQSILLENNTLFTIIFGDNGSDTEFIDTGGQKLAFSTMLPFFGPNLVGNTERHANLSYCDQLYEKDGNTFSEKCKTELERALKDQVNDDYDETILDNYITGVEKHNIGLTFRLDIAKLYFDSDEKFLIDYKVFLSTAAAIVVLLILITFCMDVALRSVKLAFLQFISPIPIISYIDPKSGKDGIFKKWYQMCFSTYLSLFVRLFGLYFGLYMINMVIGHGFTDTITGKVISDPWIQLFMIIGILMFIKQLPKILEGFGIKLDGGGKFQLNPFKKFEDEAFGGKQILGFGAAAGAGIAAGAVNTVTRMPRLFTAFDKNTWNYDNWKDSSGKRNWRAVAGGLASGLGHTIGAAASVAASGVAGASSAAWRGAGKTLKGEKAGKAFVDSYGEAMFSKKVREDNLRKAGLEDGTLSQKIGFGASSVFADISRYAGVLNEGQSEYLYKDEQDKKIKSLQEANASLKSQQSDLRKKNFSKYEEAQNIGKNIDALLESDTDVKKAKTAWENAKERGDDDATIERLRQIYKAKKAEVLDRENKISTSAIHGQVDKYNSIRNEMNSTQQGKFAELKTDITYKPDINGQFIRQGNNTYEVHTDSYGINYFIDSSGLRVNQVDWASFGAVRSKIDSSGVTIMGDNDTAVSQEKIVFETSEAYTDISKQIEENEKKIDDIKIDPKYINASDENSQAKLANANRWNAQKEQPGFKPSANATYDPPHRGGYNPPFGAPPTPPGTPPGNPPGPHNP